MQAIRIEHPNDGNGLWMSKNDLGEFIIDDTTSCYSSLLLRHEKFLTPCNDKNMKGFTEGMHFCAFKSMKQLQQWVLPEEIKEIIQLGFKVYLLELSECIEGEYQIGYDKACITKKEDITSLFT